MLSRRWMLCSSARWRARSSACSPSRCARASRAACPSSRRDGHVGHRLARRRAIALVTGAFAEPIDTRDVLVFAAIGAAVPGLSQIAFVQAIRLAGAARAAVLIGVAPLLSFVLAAMFLGESLNAGLVAGAALIVAAGASLSFERVRPPGLPDDRRGARRALRRPLRRFATRSSAGRRETPRWIRWCAPSSRWRPPRSCSCAWTCVRPAEPPAGADARRAQGVRARRRLPRRRLPLPDRRTRPRARHDRRAAQRDAVAVGRHLRGGASSASARRSGRGWSPRPLLVVAGGVLIGISR